MFVMKQQTKLIIELERNGYIVERHNAGHLKVRRPNGSYLMTMSASPSAPNAERQARRLLRKLGVEL